MDELKRANDILKRSPLMQKIRPAEVVIDLLILEVERLRDESRKQKETLARLGLSNGK